MYPHIHTVYACPWEGGGGGFDPEVSPSEHLLCMY